MLRLLKDIGRALIVKAFVAVGSGAVGVLYSVLSGDAIPKRTAIVFALIGLALGASLALLVQEAIRAWHDWQSRPDYAAWGAHEYLTQKQFSCLWADLQVSDENFSKPSVQHRRAALYAYGRSDFFWNPEKWLPSDVDQPVNAQRLAGVALEICESSDQNIPRIVEEIATHKYDGIGTIGSQ